MKAFLRNSVVILLTIVAMSSAYASWKCKVHNARGQEWYGTAPSRSGASAAAIKFCVRNSTYASNCTVDYCNAGDYPGHAAGGRWQCDMTNARGQLWIGTGDTRAIAASNAARFCASHSEYARNCHIRSCFVRY